MFRSFFTTIFRGSSAVLCAVTIPPADLRSLSLYYYAVCGRMCLSSVRIWCSCLLVICLFTSRSPTDKNTKHAQMTYTCGHILCNNTNSMNANQREKQQRHKAQWRTPLKMVVKKKPKHVGVLYLQTRF